MGLDSYRRGRVEKGGKRAKAIPTQAKSVEYRIPSCLAGKDNGHTNNQKCKQLSNTDYASFFLHKGPGNQHSHAAEPRAVYHVIMHTWYLIVYCADSGCRAEQDKT